MSVISITKDNFQSEVINSKKPVLLDFFATWCGPCMMMSPIVDEIENELNSIVVGKIDVDGNPELASSFGITSIPTFVVIRDGIAVSKAVGARSKEQLLSMLSE